MHKFTSVLRAVVVFAWPVVGCASTTTTAPREDAAIAPDSKPSSDRPLDDRRDAAGDSTADADATTSVIPCIRTPCLDHPILRGGDLRTLLVLPDGRVFHWGFLSRLSTTFRVPTREPSLLSTTANTIVDLQAQGDHQCALYAPDGVVRCWGENVDGSLGVGDTEDRLEPTEVSGLRGITQLAVGGSILAARGTELWWWGLPLSGFEIRPIPTRPQRLTVLPDVVTAFSRGNLSVLGGVFLRNGTIIAWGGSPAAQLLGRDGMAAGPTLLTLPEPASTLAFEGAVGGFLSTRGTAWFFGRRTPLLTLSTDDPRETWAPTAVTGVTDLIDLQFTDSHACGLTSRRRVRCWGSNDFFQLGIGSRERRSFAPGPEVDLPPVRELVVGYGYTCALTMADEVYCWGRSDNVGLRSNFADQPRPVRVPIPL